jgi:hypothetical protein
MYGRYVLHLSNMRSDKEARRLTSSLCSAYALFTEMKDMDMSLHHLKLRLHLEQTRLLRWGKSAGVIGELMDAPSRALKLNRNLILDVLQEIQTVFEQTTKITNKHARIFADTSQGFRNLEGADRDILCRALEKLHTLPRRGFRRLEWASVDKEKLESSIKKLIGLNDTLEGLLSGKQMDTLVEDQRQMFLKVLQLHNKVDDLKAYAAAMRVEPALSSSNVPRLDDNGQSQGGASGQDFADLADFKASIPKIDTREERDKILAEIQPVRRNQVTFSKRTEGSSRSEGSYKNRPVWIEWKDYESAQANFIAARVSQIVALLQIPKKPKLFHCPHCVGYFKEGTNMFGFLYEKPNDTLLAPTSLLELFSRQDVRPSLGQRIRLAYKLATTIFYLHAVGWMHKSLRSDNVLFFVADGVEIPCDYPTISGYDFARPASGTTQHVYGHPDHDVYRHPETNRSDYEEAYDIYSLGIVLVEVAYWQSIREIIETSSKDEVKERLLDANTMRELKARVGDGYADAVRDCLQAPWGEHGRKEAELQKWFQDNVVSKLDQVRL